MSPLDDNQSTPSNTGGPRFRRGATGAKPGDSALAGKLRREIEGDVLFDAFTRGRYSTDASIYQIEPIGVVVPRHAEDITRAMQIADDAGVPVLPRGGGTSQCGQTVGEALVIDTSKYMDRIVDLDTKSGRVTVQPGIVLDRLNRQIANTGYYFPVDVSPSNRATIGGMTGNNSCGSRSIRYGNMVHNVRAIDAILSGGDAFHFDEVPENLDPLDLPPRYRALIDKMRALHQREGAEIASRFPKLLRRVGGYNIDSIDPTGHNMAHLLVGSEGTLGFSTAITLDLARLPAHKTLGVCHFPTFRDAMEATRHIVTLGPAAVELVDKTLMDLAREIPAFAATMDTFIKGDPEALLLVEFAGEDAETQRRDLARLVELMGDLGFGDGVTNAGIVQAVDPAFQKEIWEVRKAGLNIVMSMKGDGKPVSFIEDCAVSLEDLPDYTAKVTEIFDKYGTKGTWYAHASVGTLHVRPILNMKTDKDIANMRAIAEETFALVREYKGSHSGEHGDGLVRSQFHEDMFGPRIVRTFEEVKDSFDPEGLFNPGKIVRPERMDDREIMRFKPGYEIPLMREGLDWSAWGSFGQAVEMCNNNGTCRKWDVGVMCPSYRVTKDERDTTRGRANSLRLALSGQLGADAFTSPEMFETMKLCVGCKGCKRECPTGVDMARMKTEFLSHYHGRHGLPLRERLVAFLPRYAPWASRISFLMNLRDKLPGAAWLSEKLLGFSAKRTLPSWHARPAVDPSETLETADVILFTDTFNRYFEPENVAAARRVLGAAGFQVAAASASDRGRPLCCGRSFLAAGLIDEARAEAKRTVAALAPLARRGVPIVGLEPSCLFTLRDEFPALLPDDVDAAAVAGHALLFEEFLAREAKAERLSLPLKPLGIKQALLHGHCHQKAFGAMGAVERVLRLVPDLAVDTVASSCCGMAGAFGYQAETVEISKAMGEISLLPAVRAADADTLIVADGTSCRHQIEDGTARQAVHVAQVLAMALDGNA